MISKEHSLWWCLGIQTDYNPCPNLGLTGSYPMTRGSHLYVPCRSVCDWDQNRIKPFWEADQGIKVTSELLKSTDQEHVAAIENQAIKSLRRKRSSTLFAIELGAYGLDKDHALPEEKLKSLTEG